MTTNDVKEQSLDFPRARTRRRGGRTWWRPALRHLLLIAFGFVMIYPLLWMVSSSLKPDTVIFRDPSLIPTQFEIDNYIDGWTALRRPFSHFIWNSMTVVMGAVIGNLISCTLAAYAFARLQFRSKTFWFALMLVTIMLPIHVLIVPQYVMFSQIGWVNTFLPLIVPKFVATDAFFIFLLVQFFRGVPRELDEAARIDGCGHFGTFFRILLPLATPALATTAIFTFIWTWNDFFSQLIFLTSPTNHTVTVALRSFVDNTGESSWGELFAMSTVSLLPLFAVFLLGQRFLVRGIATTGIK